MLEAVKQNGSAVQYASEELRGDQDVGRIVLEAMKQNCLAARLGGATTWTPRCRAGCAEAKRLGLASRFGWATWRPRCRAGGSETERMGLQHASKELRGDRDVVLEAVRRNGFLLRFALEELRGDHDVVMEAVKENGWAGGPGECHQVQCRHQHRREGQAMATRLRVARGDALVGRPNEANIITYSATINTCWKGRGCGSPGVVSHQDVCLTRSFASAGVMPDQEPCLIPSDASPVVMLCQEACLTRSCASPGVMSHQE